MDETGLLAKGEKSVGVFLACPSEKGAAFLDRALYLPRAWKGGPARRAEACARGSGLAWSWRRPRRAAQR